MEESHVMKRVLSGIQPTSVPTLGNYLGAMRRWPLEQHENESFWFLPDLHVLTVDHDPEDLRQKTLNMANTYLAIGLDPEVSTLYAQSHIRAHTEASWLMESTARFGELRRMTQFKDKSGGEAEGVHASLFTYPALMAADILLYDIEEVPVGEDQRQHVEFTRDVAQRFNTLYGQTFVVPKATLPKVSARVRDLQNPTKKMSKSTGGQGTVWLYDTPAEITKKFKRAVTDNETEVRYDWENKPGVSNLLEILSSCTGTSPEDLAKNYSQYGPLKTDTAEAFIELVRPVQERYTELSNDPSYTMKVLAQGAAVASEIADATLTRAKTNIGLLMPQ